jgi:phospholipid/cholesterol/gamma-HCH transport system substrate-binding protein
MRSRAQQVRLGIFITVSLIVLAIVVILITGSKFLTTRDTYYISYKDTSVSGLEIGAAVKYHGIRIGRVETIKIDPHDVTKVVVTVTVEGGTPLKEDVKALTAMVGITGLKQIELSGGSNEARLLKPGSYITVGTSLADNITGKAEVITEKVEMLLNNLIDITGRENKEKFVTLVDQTNTALQQFNTVLGQNTEPITAAMKDVPELVVTANNVLTQLDSILGNLNRVSADFNRAEIATIMQNLDQTLNEINKTFTHIDLTVVKGRKDIIFSLQLLKQTLQNVNEFSRMLAEDPSIIIRGVDQKSEGGK